MTDNIHLVSGVSRTGISQGSGRIIVKEVLGLLSKSAGGKQVKTGLWEIKAVIMPFYIS